MARHRLELLSLLVALAGCGNRTDDRVRDDGHRKHEAKDESVDDSHDPDAKLLEPLLGDWVSTRTGRKLHAVRAKDGKSVDFQIVDAGEFLGQYSARETRFRVRIGAGKTYVVTDFYRMVAPPGFSYSASSYASCLGAFTKDDVDHPLTARFVKPDDLEVTFVSVTTTLSRGPGASSKVLDGCIHKITGVLKNDLVRKTP
jgi:hypothetical protein